MAGQITAAQSAAPESLRVVFDSKNSAFQGAARSKINQTRKRSFATLHDLEPGSLGQRSRADGMAIDAKGRLYVGISSGVQVIDPKGRHLGTIRVPAVVRNLAFAGPRRRVLYMTTLEALYRVQMLSEGPAGRAK